LKAVEAMAVASGVRVLGAIEKPLRKDALASMLYLHAHPSARGAAATGKALDASAVERAVELGQFKTWYSPVLDVTFMRTVSADVVPRWESPEHGTLSGDQELTPVLDLPAAGSVMRALVSAALNAGGLWTQMGWNGVITMPTGLATIRDAALWDWMSATVKQHGANGTVAVAVDGGLFAADAARGAFAVARATMDGYYLVARVQDARQLDALRAMAACNVVTCPAEWVEGDAAAMQKVYDFASRMGAEIGVSGVNNAALLGKLAAAGIRRASGTAIGRPGSAAETYDTHLAFR
jgi:EAL domain-containing protein (putative c-di-GMP-specific phosphodiesterase class I)